MSSLINLKSLLEEKYRQYNQVSFINKDPISIPHRFVKKQDIEIAGLFTAILAWGQRKTIISKGLELMNRMDFTPHEFILNHRESDLKKLTSFKHRTFNSTDTLYFVYFLNKYYLKNQSLEDLFIPGENHLSVENGLIRFHDHFFSLELAPQRTRKHIPTPIRKSTCKRLNMFLRWMVRKDGNGVDFGIWNRIKPAQLICPVDLHVDRVARQMGLISRKQTDWITALELTENLKKMDPQDPVKYDFSLFGLGVIEKYGF
jgi:uncharacterized protein (TIGR02757 family)